MKKDRFVVSVICILLMDVSIAIGIHYFNVYQSHTRYVGYLVLSLTGFAEFLLAGLSLCFCLKLNKSGLTLITYIITVILAVPVFWVVLMWLMYFAGLQLIPPPQQ